MQVAAGGDEGPADWGRGRSSGRRGGAISAANRYLCCAHHFLRDALFRGLEGDPGAYWHRPIIIRDPKARLGMSSG
jgi:hypothetical protein